MQQRGLVKENNRVLVALSGGADSVALLRVLLQLQVECVAAHCNFRLRGEESDRDEAFVRNLCKELGVELQVVHFDTAQEARKRGISIEMAARELRYAWFEEVRQATGCEVIAVAHHRDDSVETMLLNLLRGTGINGLRGIRPQNGRVVRPLLEVSREEILQYLERMKQPYVTDSSNLQDEYTRNKIRLNLLPMMEEVNPAIKETLLQTARHLDQAATLYNIGIAEGKKRVMKQGNICIEALLAEPAPEALLFELLHPLGFNAAQIAEVWKATSGQPGKRFYSEAWQVVKDRKLLLIAPREATALPSLHYEVVERTADFVIPRDSRVACLDAAKLKGELTLRKWQEGDCFVPLGMKGKKRVSDYLTDRKRSLLQKEQQCVLCCNNEIVWLVGERIDQRYRVTEATRSCLLVSVKATE